MRICFLNLVDIFIARGSQNWYNFKLPFGGFYDQPRTVVEAEDAGWTKLPGSEDCKYVNRGT